MWPIDWHIYISNWPILKVKVKVMHISAVNFSQMLTDRANILPPNRKSHVGFRLPDLNLILTYSKGQLGSWNGLSPNILAVLLNNTAILL